MSQPRITLVSALSVRKPCGTRELAEYAPPLGILTLAALVREKYPVEILDLDELWWRSSCEDTFTRGAFAAIRDSQPDVLGFSSVCGSYPRTMRMIEKCSRDLPDTVLLLGGPHASVVDVPTMEAFPHIDFVLRGEADETFPALLDAIATGASPESVGGLTHRARGKIVRNPNAPPIADLDALPLPAYDLLPVVDALASMPIEAGRGCPFACRFCSTNDFFRRRFRLKSARRTLDDMRALNERFGVTAFDLVHDMFTVDKRKVAEFCELLIRENCTFEWSCSARTDFVDAALLQLMAQSGCRDVFFGVETGSKRMQRIIDKDLDLDQARQVLREANDAGLMTTSSLIVGYPDETKDDLRDTVRFFSDTLFIESLHPLFNILTPLPETPITTQYRGQLTLDEEWAEISENAELQDADDQALILRHPKVFENFYAFPYALGRPYLRCLRDFLNYGNIRCSGLMKAMYRAGGDLLDVFDTWHNARGPRKHAYYSGDDFIPDLIDFALAQYPEDPSIVALSRFYLLAMNQREIPNCQSVSPPPAPGVPSIVLPPGVRLIATKGDVNAIFRALREAGQPDPAAFHREVVAVIRPVALNRSRVYQFPATTTDILRHAEKSSPIEEVVRDFETRNVRYDKYAPREVIRAAIEMLQEKGLVDVAGIESPRIEPRKNVKAIPAVAAASANAPSSPFSIVVTPACG